MKRCQLILSLCIFLISCTTYTNLLVSEDYKGDKITVQRHADPCCGWAGLRFIYNEGNKTEHVIYFYWFDVPYAIKQVRTLNGRKVVRSENYQVVFDTARYREPFIREVGFGDTTKYDLNDQLLSTKRVKPTIPLNHIDSILLFHAPSLLTSVNNENIWLLGKAAGYIKRKETDFYNNNGIKRIK